MTRGARYDGSTEDMHPYELEARLGLLKCPNCGSRSVGVRVHSFNPEAKKEWGCTGCGAYSTNKRYSGEQHNQINMDKAVQVAREGIRQQTRHVKRSDIEKIHSEADEATNQ
ncbi:MAG: hypothetical protein ABEJ07_05390 [Candidatus Nanohaloarchaea archaeon]